VSGRAKEQLTDEERLKLLTREAHEAAQACREAARDMRAEHDTIKRARAEHVQFLDKSITLAVAAAVEYIRKIGQDYVDQLQVIINEVQDHVAGLLGAGDIGAVAQFIIKDASQKLAEQLAAEIRGNELGLVNDPEKRQESARRRRKGQVFVTTDPAPAPPGSIVLDMR
jgi:hypothetical protein